MSHRLRDHINSKYFEAANALTSKKARRKIVVYVESYDDILFWRQVLGRFENSHRYFEIMLPSRDRFLQRGKKAAIAQLLDSVGSDMLACVDADYDYLIQGATETSKVINSNPYIFHTYVYAIENYQCYAPSLHEVCVMITLNDHQIFDFEAFLTRYSQIIYPLFVWNIWFYRSPNYNRFTISEFNQTIELGTQKIGHPDQALVLMQEKVRRKIAWLRKHFPEFMDQRGALEADLQRLGVTPDTTYLYIQGHHLFDNVVAPIVTKICERLVAERQSEIRHMSQHNAQRQTELSCYNHSIQDVTTMLKKNNGYQDSQPYQKLLEAIEKALNA
ncbi:MAG: DUF4435 domain-containing protein [Prevotella sp.]|nr:DUF4435 domain-containing protein [Prevotella sp.]